MVSSITTVHCKCYYLTYCFKIFINFSLKKTYYFKKNFNFSSKKGCKVKLTKKTNHDGTFTNKTNNSAHTHIIDVRDKVIKEQREEIKISAKTTTKTTRSHPSNALSECGWQNGAKSMQR